MSMYEIEYLMENTVRLIDKSKATDSQKRNLIWNAYHIQNKFDCSYTHFRLMDILLKYGFVQTYNNTEFPLYATHPQYFDELANSNSCWIREKPTEERSKTNDTIAYWDKQTHKIYVDYNSTFYNLFPEEKAEELLPLSYGLGIIKEAHQQGDKETIHSWTAFMIFYLIAWFPSEKTAAQLKQDYFLETKNILQQYNYDSFEPLDKRLCLYEIEEEWLSDLQNDILRFVLNTKKE